METRVEEKKPTRRKIQADTTRKKLYDISIALMEKKGLPNTTIIEICRKAGVSVGTFYNYFSSKDDVYIDIFQKADDYFENTVANSFKDSNLTAGKQIVLYFRYYARYNQRRGLANITQLYNSMSRFFAVKGRSMQELLKQIIQRGQAKAEYLIRYDSRGNHGISVHRQPAESCSIGASTRRNTTWKTAWRPI